MAQQSDTPDQPEIRVEESRSDYARIVASPLRPGFGTTLGNALRRMLLSSLPGAAVTSVRIEGVQHEFSTIPSVKEDMIEFLLNVKELRLRALSSRPGTLVLDVNGREGPVVAADIQAPEHYEIVNPELYLATINSPEGHLHVELNAEMGHSYVPAGTIEDLPIGVIPVDAIFSPVRKVNYSIEQTRVGQAANYEKLTLEVWTDGSLGGVESISRSANTLINQFRLFADMGRRVLPVMEKGIGSGNALTPDRFNMPIEELNLAMRAYNCLRRSGLMTVGQVLEKSEDELLALRNFGRKSYDELRVRLDELGILPLDRTGGEMMEALPLGEEEEPIRRVSGVEVEEEEEIAEEEPSRPSRRSRAKASQPQDEEIPEWKRKLLELTGEVEETEEGGQ